MRNIKWFYIILVLIIIFSALRTNYWRQITNPQSITEIPSLIPQKPKKILLESQLNASNTHIQNSSCLRTEVCKYHSRSVITLLDLSLYESHSSIIIDGNTDFKAQASTNNWPGNGSQDSPYVITDYDTTESSFEVLNIHNTDVHFKVVNCIFSEKESGLHLINITNGQFIDNTIINMNSWGILLVDSENNLFIGNTIVNSGSGIALESSKKNYLTDNKIINNTNSGISLFFSNENQILENRITNSTIGIEILHSSEILLENNSLVDNKDSGINLNNLRNGTLVCNKVINSQIGVTGSQSINISFFNNLITNNIGGLFLMEMNELSIKENYISNTFYDGIYLGVSSNISVTNNTIICNSTSGDGLFIFESVNIFIVNNTLTNNSNYGIRLEVCDGSVLRNNLVKNNGITGIQLGHSGNCTLTGNYLANNGHIGIYLAMSSKNVIKENCLINNSMEIRGITLENCLQEEVVNNTINGKDLLFWQNITGDTVPSGVGQIILVNCNTLEVVNQKIERVSIGIHGLYCTDMYFGNNTISHGRIGILLESTVISTITGNILLSNTETGLALYSSSKNLIQDNKISNCGKGIHFDTAWNNILYNNTISTNTHNGIYFFNVWNNLVSDNEIAGNGGYGLIIDSGAMYSERQRTTGTDNNTIMWNWFINNTLGGFNVHQAKDDGLNNEITHNYWNDWTTPDANGNGIVDNPYSIDGVANNRDRYPHVFPTFATSTPDIFYNLPELIIRTVILGLVLFMFGLSYQRLRKAQ